jgi:uncharacterized protein
MSHPASPSPFRQDALEIESDQVHLRGSRCPACGAVAFPPRRVCASCLATSLTPVRLGQAGRLYTYAIVRQAPKAFPTPYIIGYVDLDEGVRVFTQVVTDSVQNLQLGTRMILTSIPLRSDDAVGHTVAYAFRPEGEG